MSVWSEISIPRNPFSSLIASRDFESATLISLGAISGMRQRER